VREHLDTVVVGGGQAGLAMSHVLTQRSREHIVFERGRIGERWRTERWDSLRFQFPNWSLQLPGYRYDGDDPDGFAHYTQISRIIDAYAVAEDVPVREGCEVISLEQCDDAYVVTTSSGEVRSARVVVATGPFQRAMIPAIADDFPSSLFHTDPTRYRGPSDLPDGAVLIVGSGASGCQIADELNQAGRTVYLSVSRHRRVPRRFRGRDVCWWLDKLGRFSQTIDSFPNRDWPPSTVVTGVNGGYDVDIRAMAAEGVVVVGRALGAANGHVSFADDAETILRAADEAFDGFVSLAGSKTADELGEEVDEDPGPIAVRRPVIESPDALDLAATGVATVVWATGYVYDYDWLRIPVFNARGRPNQHRGVTAFPGLYFLGLHWMHTFRSGLFSGVGDDATYLADHMDGPTFRARR
jgi:putative flavoprotein involved in K+ transport